MVWLIPLGFLAVAATIYFRGPAWLGTLFVAATISLFAFATPWWAWTPAMVLFLGGATLLHYPPWRKRFLTAPVFRLVKASTPPISQTEREAIDAGTTWWETALFQGRPDWAWLGAFATSELSDEEQAFLDGPVEELCGMLDDWEITREHEDLPAQVWAFLKEKRFFGMIVPKHYGGLEFSARAHSEVVLKLTTRSASAAVTVMVPNSLGPAELLLHYGTEEQKALYLPQLARGDHIPCFALTGPEAGSDASAIPDTGVVCHGDGHGQPGVVGIKLNWRKRYITLAPVATLLGLAFKLYDPEHLLGTKEDLGISVALIPTDTPGVRIGNRHRPMDQAFCNGPTEGDDVFIPVSALIGGPVMAGKGWKMLMESLAAGRAISLPALSTGSAKLACRATGAYAAVRRQFRTAVGQFEGVQEALARIAGNAYIMDATRVLTVSAVDRGEQPSVVSAIAKYHLTERMRQVVNDAMDVHGGRAICMGPRNYLARGYQGIPIAITVEGANILTRSLIIFGQGAIRCHPYLLREMEAVNHADVRQGLDEFDRAFWAHVAYSARNLLRCITLGITGGRMLPSPTGGAVGRYYRQIERMSVALAVVADVALLIFGGKLKRLERLSARLGDVLSNLYLATAALKRFSDQGAPAADRPLIHWACRDALYRVQTAFDELFRNMPRPWVGRSLRLWVFPLGMPYAAPNDANDRRVARLLLRPSPARDRLTEGTYIGAREQPVGCVEDAMLKMVSAEKALRKLLRGVRNNKILTEDPLERIEEALSCGILDEDEARALRSAEEARLKAIAVDDFAPETFGSRPRKGVKASALA